MWQGGREGCRNVHIVWRAPAGALQLRPIILHQYACFSLRGCEVWRLWCNLPAALLYFLVLFTLVSVGLGVTSGRRPAPAGAHATLILIGAHVERTRATWLWR
jgi:hypothetical protein